jgi:hypothetical protein
LVALAAAIAREPTTTRLIWPCAIVGSVVSLVLAQSRGAILGAGIGICVALGLLALRKSLVRGITVTAPWIAAGLIAAIALAMVAPPSTGNILYRFNIAGILRDPSVVIRVAQAQSIFADSGNGPPAAGGDIAACVAKLAPVSSPEPGHEPGPAAPSPAPTFDADRLASAVAEYYCATGRWPSDIAHDIVPTYLHDIPGGSGLDAFSLYSSKRGFAVGLGRSVADRSEDPGAGSFPNLLANSSFEEPGNPPDQWLITPGVSTTALTTSAAFSRSSVDVSMPAGGAIYQLVVADLPTNSEYTTGVWARSVDPNGATLQLYVVALTATGARIEPVATRTFVVPGTAGWQHLALTFETPADHLLSLQVMFRAPSTAAHVLLDGATMTEGPFALPFGALVDQSAGSAGGSGLPVFRQSPLLGVGPQKDEVVAVIDNEYTSFLVHYGIVGVLAYVLLFASAFMIGIRRAFRGRGWVGLIGVSLAAFTVALAVSGVSAGSFHQVQIMFVYWLIVGVAGATAPTAAGERRELATNVT